MSTITQHLLEGDWSSQGEDTQREPRVMRRWLLHYGAIAAGSVDHHAEYLPLEEDIHYATEPPYHATEEERAKHLIELKSIATGMLDWKQLFHHPSWEHPMNFAVALSHGGTHRFDIINVRNNGAIPQLPNEAIVEAPVQLGGGSWRPEVLPMLPEPLVAICKMVSNVHELAAEAAVKRDRFLARKAIDADPAIANKNAAYLALDRMLLAHADLLPQFFQDKEVN